MKSSCFQLYRFCLWKIRHPISGGYGGGVPPLPIPNREVKPAYADGTAMQCGRVGSRLLFNTESSQNSCFERTLSVMSPAGRGVNVFRHNITGMPLSLFMISRSGYIPLPDLHRRSLYKVKLGLHSRNFFIFICWCLWILFPLFQITSFHHLLIVLLDRSGTFVCLFDTLLSLHSIHFP